MNLKHAAKLLVPPILWSAVSSRKSKPRDSGGERSLLAFIENDEFKIAVKQVTQDRGVYFVPRYAEHRPASRAILNGRIYEPATHELIDKIMQHKGGSMTHAGTFFGDMLPTFSRSCPATVYAFEPVLENYVLAKLCIAANRLENVFIQNAGLSDGTKIGHVDTGNAAGEHRGGASKLSAEGHVVSLVTIDSFGLQDISVIQLDVEGHELPALQGARATIERSKPIILVEDNAQSCNHFLEEMGYNHIGTIPGLFVWVRPADEALVAEMIPQR